MMRRFLMCAGVNGKLRSLEWLQVAVAQLRPDAVLFAGGMLDAVRSYTPHASTRWGLSKEDGQFLEELFTTMGNLGVFTALIPGPQDVPLEEVLRLGMHQEVESPNFHMVHATLIEQGDSAVIGMGGTVSADGASDRETSSRTVTEYALRPLGFSDHPHKLLLLPEAPTGRLGGREGNTLVGELIDSLHPSLCVVGGPNERRGFERIGHTLVVNPAWIAEGSAVWLDWTRRKENQIELLNLRHPGLAPVASDLGAGD